MGRAGLVFRVHPIGEVDRLVVGQAALQLLVILDKGGLLGLVGLGRQAFRALVLEAQAMQQLDAAGMAVSHPVGRRNIGRHLAGVAVKPRVQMRRKLGLLGLAQMTRPAVPVEQRQLIQTARAIVLVPTAHRVVVEVKHLRHLATAQTVIQKQDGVRPPTHPVGLARVTHHRLQRRAFFRAQETASNHQPAKNRFAAGNPELFSGPRGVGV